MVRRMGKYQRIHLRSSAINILFPILIILLFQACSKQEEPSKPYVTTPYSISVPLHFPQQLNIPYDNPMTVEGIELGRYLFYDGRLSGRTDPDSMMSCATCHIQSHSFECGINHPKYTGGHPHGVTGLSTPHYMLPLINLVWNTTGYEWNGYISYDNPDKNARELEDIVWLVITSPYEMCSDTGAVVNLISNTPGYPELFLDAFGSNKITITNLSRAIAQFIRTLISCNSKFDRFLRGEAQLTPSELNGYVLFMTEQGADCFHCHGGDGNPLFTTGLFYNNGKDSVFTDALDRSSVTGNSGDIGAYKAPTLRNLAYTAPYMHDGRFRTIDEVIDFYSDGLVWSPSISVLMHHITTGGIRLTLAEKADLKAFLLTLSDSSFVVNPAFSKPDKFPDQ
jgi:cytochrome c peroxidase